MKSKNEIIEEQQEIIENLRSQIKDLNVEEEENAKFINYLEEERKTYKEIANVLRKERDDLSKQLEASKPFVCCCQRCRRRTDNDEK